MTEWLKRWNIMLLGKDRLALPLLTLTQKHDKEGMKGVQAVAVYVSVTQILPIF